MGTPPPIELSTLGMWDSMILMVLALVVFGPRRLPQIGRQIGKLMYEFRKASNDFKFQMEEELRLSEEADRRKKEEAERARNLALSAPAQDTIPTQTVEAQAAVGAVEQASVSAPPAAAAPADTATSESERPAEQHVRYPRINPPSSGEPIPAAKPYAQTGNGLPPDAAAEPSVSADNGAPAQTSVAAEANIGADAAPVPANPAADQESARTETVTQHG